MPDFEKKPVKVHARHFDGTKSSADEIIEWIGEYGGSVWFIHPNPGTVVFVIGTLEGKMMVREGDYVIRGVQGEFYPCKPDIFLSTYKEL